MPDMQRQSHIAARSEAVPGVPEEAAGAIQGKAGRLESTGTVQQMRARDGWHSRHVRQMPREAQGKA